MSKVTTYGAGVASVQLTGSMKEIVERAIKTANRAVIEEFEKEVEKLEKEARANWPIRQKRYGKSEGSKDQFQTGLRFIPPGTIVAFVANNAPYAWAIRAGEDGKSTTNVKPKQRIAEELLWKPAQKDADKIIKTIAQKSIKTV